MANPPSCVRLSGNICGLLLGGICVFGGNVGKGNQHVKRRCRCRVIVPLQILRDSPLESCGDAPDIKISMRPHKPSLKNKNAHFAIDNPRLLRLIVKLFLKVAYDRAGCRSTIAKLVQIAQKPLCIVRTCPGRIGDYSTAPPTEPYVKISLIRFLGTARFHTARLPDVADNPRHPSPSALQHVFSRLSYV